MAGTRAIPRTRRSSCTCYGSAGGKVIVATGLGMGLGVTALVTYTTGVFFTDVALELGLTRTQFEPGYLRFTLALVLGVPAVGWLIDRVCMLTAALAGAVIADPAFAQIRASIHQGQRGWGRETSNRPGDNAGRTPTQGRGGGQRHLRSSRQCSLASGIRKSTMIALQDDYRCECVLLASRWPSASAMAFMAFWFG